MKKIYVIIIMVLLLILDTSLAPFISIRGILPSFLLTFAIAYSIINGSNEGIIVGIISGGLQDIFFQGAFGVNILVNMIICYFAGGIGEGIWRERRVIPFIITLGASILKYVGLFIIMYFFGVEVQIGKSIYFGLYNSIIMLIIYRRLYEVCNRDEKEYSWRFKMK